KRKKEYFFALKMSEFIPKKQHLQEVLLHYFILKKSAAKTNRLLELPEKWERVVASEGAYYTLNKFPYIRFV
ncbi:hypothetical protein ALC62_06645, partial [Cyphomyrmex costatus]